MSNSNWPSSFLEKLQLFRHLGDEFGKLTIPDLSGYAQLSKEQAAFYATF